MPEIIAKIKSQHGFILKEDVAALVEHDRFAKCLIRSSMGRCQCAAQYVDHFVEMIDNHEHDYVRDVSLL